MQIHLEAMSMLIHSKSGFSSQSIVNSLSFVVLTCFDRTMINKNYVKNFAIFFVITGIYIITLRDHFIFVMDNA